MNLQIVHPKSCDVVQTQVFRRLNHQNTPTADLHLNRTIVLKPDTVFGRLWTQLMIFLLVLCTTSPLKAQTPTTFTFTLDEPCKTSAGVFLTNGTLVRTLWSKVPYYAAGTYAAVWDGLDDNSNAVAEGTYEIKLLQHNTEYVWDGAIGNSSAQPSGITVHRGFYFIQGMAMSGSNAFYCSGYNEAEYGFRSFITNEPQQVSKCWFWSLNNGILQDAPNIASRSWIYAAADTDWVYFACPATYDPANASLEGSPGCIVATIISNYAPAYFTNGILITNGPGSAFINGLLVGSQPGLSGLSVQQNGNLLAVAVAPDNLVYLLDKRSGAAIAKFNVNSPGRLNFSPDGSLWVISSNNLICYTNLSSSPSVALTISGLSKPLDVAVNPTNSDIILVADGGSSQQVKAFNSAGTLLWTYGLPGGYPSNGVAVATNKFWFSYEGVDQTFLCIAPDGSFWVGDEESHRTLHISGTGNYIEQIMYQPHSYACCACQGNTSRVFNEFLEFSVNYNNPLSNGWTLVNNWKVNMPTNICNNIGSLEGLYQVTTLPNGRTYGFVPDSSLTLNPYELVELTNNQLRLTGIHPFFTHSSIWLTLKTDGSLYYTPEGKAEWYKASLTAFDTNNNPLWGGLSLIASGRSLSTDPVPRCCVGYETAAITTNNILISYDSTLNNGWHFGGLQIGGSTNWLWETGAPDNLNGRGNYAISNGLTYAGDMVHAIDRSVVFGYHGEFFLHQGEASQTFHYYDDGLFVGQFGEADNGHGAGEGTVPGFVGNGYSPDFIKTGDGGYYYYQNDEAAHGPQRWHFVNAGNIREQTGIGALGADITLTTQPSSFPIGVTGQNATQSAILSWQPVQGAASYNIYYSLNNGGPYNTLAGNTTDTQYLLSGLTNGQTYFCVVTAITGGTEGNPAVTASYRSPSARTKLAEGIPSEQVEIFPFDTNQTVLCVGNLAEAGQQTPVLDINTNAPDLMQPRWVGCEHLTGVFTPTDLASYGFGWLMNTTIGTQGYLLYDWQGAGSNLTYLPSSSPFTITKGSGWIDTNYLEKEYRVGNILGTNWVFGTNWVLGVNWGLSANQVGTIKIGVSDNNFHILTVASPARSIAPRQFTLGITSTNGSSVQYSVNESYAFSHTFQFLFKGNITLQANATGGSGAYVQAIFLDSPPPSSRPAPALSKPAPPSKLHFVTNAR
jgi:hypothetical protein